MLGTIFIFPLKQDPDSVLDIFRYHKRNLCQLPAGKKPSPSPFSEPLIFSVLFHSLFRGGCNSLCDHAAVGGAHTQISRAGPQFRAPPKPQTSPHTGECSFQPGWSGPQSLVKPRKNQPYCCQNTLKMKTDIMHIKWCQVKPISTEPMTLATREKWFPLMSYLSLCKSP